MTKRKKNKKDTAGTIIRSLILIAAFAVFCYAGYRLYTIFHSYHKADVEYAAIEEKYTSRATAETSRETKPESDDPYLKEIEPLLEDDTVPLEIDWDSLKAVNADTVGWIYIEGVPSISYPVVRGIDNDYYLHYTFEGSELFIGAIFENCTNSADFSDPNTIIYGHRINTGSMFGELKNLNDQSVYDEHPYFWILTPEGNYRYHIYSVMKTPATGEAYTLFSDNGPELLTWEKNMQNQSEVKNDVILSESDRSVLLSTCTDDSSVRLVVIGKCVSTDRPPLKENSEE